MSGVCHDVQVEPHLQPLSGELLRYKSVVCEDDARVDIRAASFWGCRHHRSFLMFGYSTLLLRVTMQSPCPAATLQRHEVINVEPMRSVFVK